MTQKGQITEITELVLALDFEMFGLRSRHGGGMLRSRLRFEPKGCHVGQENGLKIRAYAEIRTS